MIGCCKNKSSEVLYNCIATDTMKCDFTTGRAIRMLKSGESFFYIARILHINKQANGCWWSQFNQSGMIIKRKSPGRRQKTGEQSNRILIRIARRNRLASSSSLLRLWNKPVSKWTVCRRLIRSGFCQYRYPAKTFLFPADNKARCRWAQNHIC